jgi:hypothetical protein
LSDVTAMTTPLPSALLARLKRRGLQQRGCGVDARKREVTPLGARRYPLVRGRS